MSSFRARLENTEALYRKAAQAELDKNYDQAFEAYVKAAQSYLEFVRNASNERDKAKYKAEMQKCMDRAQKIKAIKGDLKPVLRDVFSQGEQAAVLAQSSQANGFHFASWSDISLASVDLQKEPDLGEALASYRPLWRPAKDKFKGASVQLSSLLPEEIVQNIITDCSLCASMAICLHHHRLHGSKLGLACMFPQGNDNLPVLSSDGQYHFRFLFNGTYRKISITESLPFTHNMDPMFISTSGKHCLWPGLLEKAYMKLMGGYDFPGSNSSFDIHCLTGWIPEHLEIKSPTFESEKAWTTLATNYVQGNCVVTVGTGQSPSSSLILHGVQLIPAHCYAVVAVHEDAQAEERWLKIINTRIGPHTAGSADDLVGQMNALSIDQPNDIIEVTWREMLSFFDGIYLNWDPTLYRNQLEFHGIWRAIPSKLSSKSVHTHLHLNVNACNFGDEILILLSRHIVDKSRTQEFMSLQVIQEEYSGDAPKFGHVQPKGTYTTSAHILVRHVIEEASIPLSIVASYDGQFEDVGFTVRVYSNSPTSWITKAPTLIYSPSPVEGTFNVKTSGGNSTFPTYLNNPQFKLVVSLPQATTSAAAKGSKVLVRLTIEGSRDVPLNLTLLWSKGGRITEITPGSTVTSSGPYSYGTAYATAHVAPGEYVVIASAFEPRHRGPFTLSVEGSTAVALSALPVEGAGMFLKPIQGQWENHSAAGSPSFGRYRMNPMYEISLRTTTEIRIRLQLTTPAPGVPMNITIFSASNDGNFGHQVGTSGPYSDSVYGVLLTQSAVAAGKYLLIPSTYNPGILAPFHINVWTKSPDTQVQRKV